MMFETADEKERFILVGVSISDSDHMEDSLMELEELCHTAGADVCCKMIQNRFSYDIATYIGKGKVEELLLLIDQFDATGIVCDDELTPIQLKNLEETLHVKIMDRTMIILDIFAQRAVTKEGKIQVELAQLKDRSNRLIGAGGAMSRLGGGIGTRGPGEKKLEIDRRIIRKRISILSRELDEVVRHRDLQRKERKKSHMPVVCIAGYTNAGKSTMLNQLTEASVLSEDQLFATLDPTTRSYQLEAGKQILLTDTVGFIHKLPHHLVNAFRSTLEEAKYADVILHVVDASNERKDAQMETVYETLAHLGAMDKPIITVFNKMDLLDEKPILYDRHADKVVAFSAKTKEGKEDLDQAIKDVLRSEKEYFEEIIPYKEAAKVQKIRIYEELLSEEYLPEGIKITGYRTKNKNG